MIYNIVLNDYHISALFHDPVYKKHGTAMAFSVLIQQNHNKSSFVQVCKTHHQILSQQILTKKVCCVMIL